MRASHFVFTLLLATLLFVSAKQNLNNEEQMAAQLNSAVRSYQDEFAEASPELKNSIRKEADAIEGIANSLEGTDDEEIERIQEFLNLLAGGLKNSTKGLGRKILQNAITDVIKGEEANTAVSNEEEESESDSQFPPLVAIAKGAISFGSTAANFVNDVGSYSGKLSSAGKFVSGNVASYLENKGFSRVANAATVVGNQISKTAESVAPLERSLAAKLEPIKSSPTFQAVRSALNVADASLSMSSAASKIYAGYKAVRNLPSTVTTVSAAAKEGVRIAKESISSLKQTAKTTFGAVGTYNTAKGAVQGVETIKDEAKNYKQTINNVQRSSTNIKQGFNNGINNVRQRFEGRPQRGVPAKGTPPQVRLPQTRTNPVKPVQARPSPVRSTQGRSPQLRTTQARPSQVRVNQSRPSLARTPQGRTPQLRPSQVRPQGMAHSRPSVQGRPSQGRPFQGSALNRPSQVRPQTRPSQGMAYSRPSVQSRPVQSRPSVSSYRAPSVSSYRAPSSSYSRPSLPSYRAPSVSSSYRAPSVSSSYRAPSISSSYRAPSMSSYSGGSRPSGGMSSGGARGGGSAGRA